MKTTFCLYIGTQNDCYKISRKTFVVCRKYTKTVKVLSCVVLSFTVYTMIYIHYSPEHIPECLI